MSTLKAALPDERFLILLRHGIAEDPVEGKRDEERSLTAEGHARMKQIARGLERALPKVPVVYTSPLLRAMQTALWVSKGYRSRITIETTAALAPAATQEEFLAFLATVPHRRFIVVGHEPNLTDSLRTLTGLTESHGVELKKGGCYGVTIAPDGHGILEWVLPPRILRKLGETVSS
jgi:phosphohistidine phosphatase